MKKLIFLLAVTPVLMINACNNSTASSEASGATTASKDSPKKDSVAFQALDTTKLAKGTAFYQCSMHADITSDKPGDCPTCGMKLDKMHKM